MQGVRTPVWRKGPRGTGELAGAAGTFSATGSLNSETHVYTISLTVKLNRT